MQVTKYISFRAAYITGETKMGTDNEKLETPNAEQTRQIHESNKVAVTDGGEPEEKDEETTEAEKSTFQRVRERLGLGSKPEFLGIGEDHVRPSEAVRDARASEKDADRDTVDEAVSQFSSTVDGFDGKRSDLETDMQRRRESYETALSEPAAQVAEAIDTVQSYAEGPIAEELTHEFDPEQGSHTFEEWEDEEELGLASYLSRLSDEVSEFDDRYTHRESKIADKEEARQELQEEIREAEKNYEEAQDQIEQQEESAGSKPIGGENEETVAEAELEAARGTLERKRDELEDEIAALEEDIQRHGEKKREHLQSFESRMDEARSTYQEVARETESYIEDVTEELDHMTDWLDELAENQISSMASILDEREVSFEGKILDDAEGSLQSAYDEAVNALGSKAAKQYAQAEKAVRELEYVEEGMEDQYFEDIFVSEDLREKLSTATDGKEFEQYLEEKMEEALSEGYNARDEIRTVFRGLEGLRDEEELA